MATRVSDGRKLKAFLRRARSAKSRSKSVSVGFFAAAKYSDGTPVTAVAAFNEFGTEGGVPERPFIRNSVADAEDVIMPVLKEGIDPKDMALDRITAGKVGEAMKSRIQREITQLREPGLSETTIRRKGSSNPLIDTASCARARPMR